MSSWPAFSPTGPIFTASPPAASAASTAARGRLPLASAAPRPLRFGCCGCQDYQDGYYTAYRHLAEEDLAFVFHYGDYIYEYGGGHARGPRRADVARAARIAVDLADYRRRYAQYKSDPDLQRAHAAHAFFLTFDDHEVTRQLGRRHRRRR